MGFLPCCAVTTFAPVSSAVPAAHGVSLHADRLERRYGDRLVLDAVSLKLVPGEVLSLLGPSGCGKTTLLKIIAGLDQPSAGSLSLGSKQVACAQHSSPPEQRDLGMVFQDYALWPHLSVHANVAFPLRMRGCSRSEIQTRVAQTLDLVGLHGMTDRAPSSLSGGQQQRVALARAIVARPSLILFDEPLSNLDRDLRETLCAEMAQLLRALGCTAVYVTHDHEEACAMADTVAVMMHGRIQQLCTPQSLWSAPASPAVAEFLKLGALLPVQRQGNACVVAGHTLCDWPVASHLDAAPIAYTAQAVSSDGQLLIPHGAVRWGRADGAHMLALQGLVVSQQYRCGQYHTWVDTALGHALQVVTPDRLGAQSAVALSLDTRQLQWFAAGA